jgi:hypothetical protein
LAHVLDGEPVSTSPEHAPASCVRQDRPYSCDYALAFCVLIIHRRFGIVIHQLIEWRRLFWSSDGMRAIGT